MPLSSTSATAAALMRNARAAYREKLRTEIRREHPRVTDEELEGLVRERISQDRAAAGRKGGAGNRRRLLVVRRFENAYADLLMQAEALVAAIRLAGDPQSDCWHDWPADLDEDAYCQRCGLAYAEFSEPIVAAS